MDTYTHGHAEPVLQSHRWRTAANSAAYLLPSLRPGLDLLDRRTRIGLVPADRERAVPVAEQVLAESLPS